MLDRFLQEDTHWVSKIGLVVDHILNFLFGLLYKKRVYSNSVCRQVWCGPTTVHQAMIYNTFTDNYFLNYIINDVWYNTRHLLNLFKIFAWCRFIGTVAGANLSVPCVSRHTDCFPVPCTSRHTDCFLHIRIFFTMFLLNYCINYIFVFSRILKICI